MAQRRTTGANWLARAAGALLIASSVCASGAESYPAKPLRLVIDFRRAVSSTSPHASSRRRSVSHWRVCGVREEGNRQMVEGRHRDRDDSGVIIERRRSWR